MTKFIRFIKRLFYYIPAIWKDEDWDYAGIYYFLKLKMQRLKIAQEQDTWHKNSNRRARQISICLEYLERYLNWPNYIPYPTDDLRFEVKEDNLFGLRYANSYNEAIRKKFQNYEEFNRKMFWKRFLQWYQGWWT